MLAQFIKALELSISDNKFVSLTLSKKRDFESELQKIQVKPVLIKGVRNYQFVLQYETSDITKNYSSDEFVSKVENYLEEHMKIANLFTISGDHVLKQNKKRKWKYFATKPTFSILPSLAHDKAKMYLIDKQSPFLNELGIVNSSGNVNKDMGDKFRQVQKFVEIIADMVSDVDRSKTIKITDMGSGKGYLTFAIYEYLHNILNIPVRMTGIELRPNLVDICNNISKKIDFKNLDFQVGDIYTSVVHEVDMLIALHACDTATDDAIYKGITNDVKWIICSPCCQHQVRKDMENTSFLKDILKHGILMERMAEILTDGFRSLILEAYGYKTKVFEFISHEHTGKNLIIVAQKDSETTMERREEIWVKIKDMMKGMGISQLHLMKLLDTKQ